MTAVADPRRELLEAPGGLLSEALAVAQEQRAINTRRAYAGTYRALAAFATRRAGGRPAELGDVDRDLIVAFRDQLAADGAAAATISARLSAIRRLADALDLDPRIQRVKTTGSTAAQIHALTPKQYQRLLAAPDLRTALGRRDRAMLRIAGDAGLRRSELVRLTLEDIVEARQPQRLRDAVAERPADTTSYVVVVRDAKGASSGTVPLSRPAWRDLTAWMTHRPAGPTTALFVTLSSNAEAPLALTAKAFERLMAKHAAAAGLPKELSSPHVLRHTFCTRLAEAQQDIDVICELARHRDIRTTRRYINVTEQRRHDAINRTFTDHQSALR